MGGSWFSARRVNRARRRRVPGQRLGTAVDEDELAGRRPVADAEQVRFGIQSPSIVVGWTPRTMYFPPCLSMNAGMAST
jgi:hypothetical protein